MQACGFFIDIVPLYLLADCMGLKNYAKPCVSHLAYKAHVLYMLLPENGMK
jgi:hypothetical protein